MRDKIKKFLDILLLVFCVLFAPQKTKKYVMAEEQELGLNEYKYIYDIYSANANHVSLTSIEHNYNYKDWLIVTNSQPKIATVFGFISEGEEIIAEGNGEIAIDIWANEEVNTLFLFSEYQITELSAYESSYSSFVANGGSWLFKMIEANNNHYYIFSVNEIPSYFSNGFKGAMILNFSGEGDYSYGRTIKQLTTDYNYYMNYDQETFTLYKSNGILTNIILQTKDIENIGVSVDYSIDALSGGVYERDFLSYCVSFDLFYDFTSKYQDGYALGYTQGQNAVINNPNSYNLYTKQQYDGKPGNVFTSVFDFLAALVIGLEPILEIELFGFLPIGIIIAVPIVFAIFSFILGLFK